MNQSSSQQVLIIDDSLDMRELLETLLKSQGYTTNSTSNGSEALDLLNFDLKHGGEMPNLILLDLRMPVMDGAEFIRLKELSSDFRNIPIILMTGEDDLSSLELKLKSAEIVSKPFNMKSILEAVQRNSIERNSYLH